MAWSLSFPSSIPSQLNPELIFKLTTTFSTPHLLPKKGKHTENQHFEKHKYVLQKRLYVSIKTQVRFK